MYSGNDETRIAILLSKGSFKRKRLFSIKKFWNVKEFENLSGKTKTLSTALGFEPRSFDCVSDPPII